MKKPLILFLGIFFSSLTLFAQNDPDENYSIGVFTSTSSISRERVVSDFSWNNNEFMDNNFSFTLTFKKPVSTYFSIHYYATFVKSELECYYGEKGNFVKTDGKIITEYLEKSTIQNNFQNNDLDIVFNYSDFEFILGYSLMFKFNDKQTSFDSYTYKEDNNNELKTVKNLHYSNKDINDQKIMHGINYGIGYNINIYKNIVICPKIIFNNYFLKNSNPDSKFNFGRYGLEISTRL